MNYEDVRKAAISNYSNSTPWPEQDVWHKYTFSSIKHTVEHWLADCSDESMTILNAGSGGTEYETKGNLIHLDIVEKYVCQFEKYLVGSIESINLPDSSIDGIICVGSVLNYADAQRSISEFSRILKPNAFLILEFERSDSAEFLWTKQHGKDIFSKEYIYNQQTHFLWMYSEKHICQLLKYYNLRICKRKRLHSVSSLLYRLGMSESKAAPYSKFDAISQLLSYSLAHNVILLGTKEILTKRDNRYYSSHNSQK